MINKLFLYQKSFFQLVVWAIETYPDEIFKYQDTFRNFFGKNESFVNF